MKPADAFQALRRYREEAETFDDVTARLKALGDTGSQAFTLHRAAIAWRHTGRYDLELAGTQALVEHVGTLDDPETLARALSAAGGAYHRVGRFSEAILHFEEALATRIGNATFGEIHHLLASLGLCHSEAGDLRRARAYLERCLDCEERCEANELS